MLIAEEVMSGWFRTGKAFAIEHWDVILDILTTAKGSTGAYTPVEITTSVKADKLSGKALMTGKIAADSMKNGLYMVFWYDTLFIAPPLIITVEQIDEGIDILDKSLAIGDKEVVSTDVQAYLLRLNQMKKILKPMGSLAVTKSRTYYIAWELPRRNWTSIFSV